ncbi:MAG: MFS transporter [Mycobacterium leprae]
MLPMTDLSGRQHKRWINGWDPENTTFWESSGRYIARRNLVWSILAEFLGFSVWQLWSIAVVFLPAAGFEFSVDQRFWIVAVASLVGAAIRILYTFAVPRFGGRNWTIASVLLLLLPIGMLVACVSNPNTPYWMFLVAAAAAGLGGGNFASSMANISFFYPEARKGTALGVNAAGGNLGVAVAQLLVPSAVAVGAGITIAYAGLMWLPLVALALAGALWRMDNLTTAKSQPRIQLAVIRHSHTWVMAFLYIGTFGSFIGYSAAMPLLVKTQFPEITANVAFIGPLVGSLFRPLGGLLADRVGGARVTLWNFIAMGAGLLGVLAALDTDSFGLFLTSMLVLFATSGVGNGSTYRMIPAIFRAKSDNLVAARHEAAAVIGLVSAIGALGGFLIPRAFGMSIAQTGSIDAALYGFLIFYVACVGTTWFLYLRRSLFVSRMPSLAEARV